MHKDDIGFVSESNVDSGKVGTVFQTTSNPTYDSLYGTKREWDKDKDGVGSVLSPNGLLMPFMTFDDGKRSSFSGIMVGSWVNSANQTPLPCQTSYGYTVAHRVSRLFSFPTKSKGSITLLTDTTLKVEYEDGSSDSCELGRLFGTDSGKTIPHKMVTDRPLGYQFDKGEIIAWNPYFFVRDWLEPTQVNALTGTPAITVMKENQDTYEDGSTMSSKFAQRFTSDVSKLRDISVSSLDSISLNVKVGDHVDYDSILCVIETGSLLGGTLKGTNLEGLQHLSDATPKAKVSGVVEKIEVLYCGDLDEMSESVLALVKKDNKRRRKLVTETGKGHPTGEVLEPTFISNNFLAKDTVLIRIYITHAEDMKAGDKAVFGNQLKSVPGKIFDGVNRTEGGQEIDAEFSYAGVMNRIVESPKYMGVGNMIIRQIGFNACKLSRGQKPRK